LGLKKAPGTQCPNIKGTNGNRDLQKGLENKGLKYKKFTRHFREYKSKSLHKA